MKLGTDCLGARWTCRNFECVSEQKCRIAKEREMADWREQELNVKAMSGYPNLQAVMLGCTSGRMSEWPSIPVELHRAAAEIRRLREIVAAQNRRNWWQRLFDVTPEGHRP